MLEVRLFGGLEAVVDGRPVELPADARARELLARLALAPGPHPRSVLAGRLRPDVREESARKTLRNALYELRQSLGADALAVTRERVALADGVWVDVAAFREHVAAGRLDAAAEVGSGVLLEGVEGDWAQQARDEHAAELARVLGALAARAEAEGRLAAASAWARRRIEAEPLSEAAHRELIRLLAAAGDRAAALAVGQALAERLRSELGIPPAIETRALVDDVRRGRIGRPGPAAKAPPLPAALARVERPEGRGPELARLERAWREATTGALGFALVAGEPGIGKTTLAGELARRIHAGGGAVLLGRSDEHALVPFQPWVEALEWLLGALPEAEADYWLTAHDAALARLLPTRGPAAGAVGGPRERFLAFELARSVLAAAADRWPVLLLLDDVHWADADSLSLLRYVGRSGSGLRALVVLCARTTELEPAVADVLAELRREGPFLEIPLSGLDDEAVAAVLARRTGSADHDAARRYRARTGGNPLFLVELVREAHEASGEAHGPPAGVRDVVARRLARLPERTRSTLDSAAVCGVEFDLITIGRADGHAVAHLLEDLDGAVEAALVAPAARPGHYAFTHALVPETIAEALPPSRRARLHLRIADALTAGGATAVQIAVHLRGAGPLADRERLVATELAAAREAAAGLAHAEAAAHYEAALRVGPADRGEVLLALGDAHDRAGRRDRARAAFGEAAELARAAGDGQRLARAALGHGGVGVVIAAADLATVRLLEEAIAAHPAEDAATAARLLARLAIEHYYSDGVRARDLSALAVERARSSGDPSAVAAALNARRVALWSPEHADERLRIADEMIAAAAEAGSREALLQGRNWRVVDLLELGRVVEMAEEVDAYEALAEEVGLPHFGWYVPLWRAALELIAGRWASADELTGRALTLGRQADDPNADLFAGIQRSNVLYSQGRPGDMDRERIEAGGAASPAATEWRVYLPLIDARAGRIDDARRLVSELSRDGGRALAMDANWHGACILAEAAVLVEDREASATLFDLLEPHARLFPVVARAIGCMGSAESYVGSLASMLGRHDEAVMRLRRAVQENERIGAEPHVVMAQVRLGEALGRSGEADAAREILQQAVARAEALEMQAAASAAAALAQQL